MDINLAQFVFKSINTTLKSQSFLNTIMEETDVNFLNSVYNKLNLKNYLEQEKQQCSKLIVAIVNNILSNNNQLCGGDPDNNNYVVTFSIPFTNKSILPKNYRQSLMIFVFTVIVCVLMNYFVETCIINPSYTHLVDDLMSILTSGEQLENKNKEYRDNIKTDVHRDIDRIREAISASTSMTSMINYSRKYNLSYHKEYDKLKISKTDKLNVSVQKYYSQTLFYFNNYFPSFTWSPTVVADALGQATSHKIQRQMLQIASSDGSWSFNQLFAIIGHVSNHNVMNRAIGEFSATITDVNANIERMKVSLSDVNAVSSILSYYHTIRNYICGMICMSMLLVNQTRKKNNATDSTITLTDEDTGIDLQRLDYKSRSHGGKTKCTRKYRYQKKNTNRNTRKRRIKTKRITKTKPRINKKQRL